MTKQSKYMKIGVILSVFIFPYSWLTAGDTVYYDLQQCRDMALTSGMSAKSQEETRLAAKYNRQAALAAMFPRVSANAAYMWNSRNPHLISNQMQFEQGTVTASEDGNASFTWSEQSFMSSLMNDFSGTISS